MIRPKTEWTTFTSTWTISWRARAFLNKPPYSTRGLARSQLVYTAGSGNRNSEFRPPPRPYLWPLRRHRISTVSLPHRAWANLTSNRIIS